MTIEEIRLLFEYDRWANSRVLQAVSTLSAEQFTRDLGGSSFRSVRDAAVHIIGGEWGWLTYWNEESPSAAFLNDLWERHDALFDPRKFPDVASVQQKWAEVAKEQMEFVNRLTEEDLRRMLPVRTTQLSLAQLLTHLANHSTYHRGQAALMMRQVQGEPLATDFALFLLDGRRAQ
jgi:uncharacterized damage-inducible protein DinB